MNISSMTGRLCLSIWVSCCPLLAIGASCDKQIINGIKCLEAPFKILPYERATLEQIKSYTRPMKLGSVRLMKRMSRYFPMIEKRLKERGLPDFLKYIPVAESRLSLHVVSPQGAAGLWQMMPNTARSYGLEVSDKRDERLDPELATGAALSFLEDLHEALGDWALALAAYNCGPGKVRRAIRQANCRNYKDIRFLLSKQTRRYIPSLVAAAYLDVYHRKSSAPTKLIPSKPAQKKHSLWKPLAGFWKVPPVVAIDTKEKRGFPPVSPLFVQLPALVELRSVRLMSQC